MNTWDEVGAAAMRLATPELLALRCPKCGAGLLIKFDPESPQANGGTAGCLMINCVEYCSGCCRDGLSESPPWFAECGSKVETLPSDE